MLGPAFLAIGLLLSVVRPVQIETRSDCLPDVDARSEVQTRKLVSVQHAVMIARERTSGDLLSAHLCRMTAGYVYRISILDRDGRIARLLVNAANGHLWEMRQ